MQFFLHTPEYVRVINDALTPSEFGCTPAEWQTLQPAYPLLLPDMVGRYWTPENHYTTDGERQYPEDFDGSVYCANVDTFALPCIYADITMSSVILRIDTPASLIFSAAIVDGEGNILPVSDYWIIRLRNANEQEVDAFLVTFSNGLTGDIIYVCPPNVPPGRLHIDEADFVPVTVGSQTYTIRLINPVEFTIYRELLS